MRFFFFGLLRDRDILETVLGRPVAADGFALARLAGYRLARLRGDSFPLLLSAPGASVEGVVVEGLAGRDIERIAFYESIEYEPRAVEVTLAGEGAVEARVFVGSPAAAHDGEDWRFEDWRARHKADDLLEAELWMTLHGHLGIAEADRLWDQAMARLAEPGDKVRFLSRIKDTAGDPQRLIERLREAGAEACQD
jgi:hypothetical protein